MCEPSTSLRNAAQESHALDEFSCDALSVRHSERGLPSGQVQTGLLRTGEAMPPAVSGLLLSSNVPQTSLLLLILCWRRAADSR